MNKHENKVEKKTEKQRFWEKVNKTDTCWNWTAATDASKNKKRVGYGVFWYRKKLEQAHRVSYRMHTGKIPKNKIVMHTCDNTLCVNPEHLVLGTQLDNVQDRIQKGRSRLNPVKGEAHGRAKLTEEDVSEIRAMSASGVFSQRKIAKRYSVSKNCIHKIVCGKTWKHV